MNLVTAARYILLRLLQAIPLVVGVIVINFILIHAAPGDPVRMMVGESAVSEEYLEQMRHELGLDRPFYVQLGSYLIQVARGNLGRSYVYRQPVLDLILSRVPATLLLMGTAYTLSSLIGVLVGTIASRRAGSLTDNAAMVLALIGYSTPPFWTGLIAIIILSLGLGWFPSGGMVNVRSTASGFARWLDILHHLALPALALTFFYLALVTRLTRASMLEVLHRDFITFARAKGLSDSRVSYRHALPNALLPVITVIGLQFGFLLSGAVLTETVFAWPGLGRLMIEAVGRRDSPILLGMFIVTSVLVVLANLITDLVYVVINPRIRIGD